MQNFLNIKKLKLFLYAFATLFLFFFNAEAQTIDSTSNVNEKEVVQIDSTQKYFIEGIVQDEKGNPLDFASVTLSQNGKIIGGKKTDINGKFKFQIYKSGEYYFTVSYLGLSSEERVININKDLKLGIQKFILKNDKNVHKTLGIIEHKHIKINIIPPGQPRKIVTREDMIHMGYR